MAERELVAFDFPQLFTKLERLRSAWKLQRPEWELNKSGADRGIEAVLIQRCPREVATYGLVRLRLEAMPEFCALRGNADWSPPEVQRLLVFARTQGGGGRQLANVIEKEWDQTAPSRRAVAALASLRFYHRREDHNPVVKSPWTEEGFERTAALDVSELLAYPIRGAFWRQKFETVKHLVSYVRGADFSTMGDEAVLRSLQSIPGVGEQTASATALFWLSRPTAIVDTYLLRLLQDHDLLPSSFSLNTANKAKLRRHLLHGAHDIEAHRPEWPAVRVLAMTYLWCCEIGRFRYCTCKTAGSPPCPIRSMC